MIIHTKSYARLGLMGNPSDGFYGKTISCAISNFWAEVTLWESPTLQIIPHKNFDPMEFSNLGNLYETASKDGYYGGLRLLYATCKKFYEYCLSHNIKLEDSGFTINYNTNIPRQVGLGGSSAIIGALTKALMEFHDIGYDIMPKPIIPNFLLSVEEDELQIRAGLQDRVIQVYGGVVYMDFSKELMEAQGYGNYEYIDARLLPNLFVAYTKHTSGESGRFHNPIRFRFEQGDREVIDAMKTFADYAQKARGALIERDYETFGYLMNCNFNLRRRLYGDAAIGVDNLKMIQIARDYGLPAKFCGSGGAIVGIFQTEEQFESLQKSMKDNGFECVKVVEEGGF
ncbi:MAG: mevalonate kinase [Candidatus Poribacteria bacterium]